MFSTENQPSPEQKVENGLKGAILTNEGKKIAKRLPFENVEILRTRRAIEKLHRRLKQSDNDLAVDRIARAIASLGKHLRELRPKEPIV